MLMFVTTVAEVTHKYLIENNYEIRNEIFILICQNNEVLTTDEPAIGTYERPAFVNRVNELRAMVNKEFEDNGYTLYLISKNPTIHKLKELDQGIMDRIDRNVERGKNRNELLLRNLVKAMAEGYSNNVGLSESAIEELNLLADAQWDVLVRSIKFALLAMKGNGNVKKIEGK